MPLDEGPDEGTQWPDAKWPHRAAGLGANVIKGRADQGGRHALALEGVRDPRAGEGDELVVERVEREAGQLLSQPGLVAVAGLVVDDVDVCHEASQARRTAHVASRA